MKHTKQLLLGTIALVGLTACIYDANPIENPNIRIEEIPLSNLDNWDSGAEILMQSFFWDVPEGGNWWQFIASEVSSWAAAGVDRVWLPPFAKSASGGYSMGYDVSDYFDLGEYEQYGTVETRFGSKEELLALIQTIHDNKMGVIADIVINHNGGGAAEMSGHDNKEHYTLFTPEAGTNMSGRFNRNWTCFKPYDENFLFYNDKNLDLDNTYVCQQLWENENSVAKYYADELGIDGWRFDYVKGYDPSVNEAWNEATGNKFSVGENWDGNTEVLEKWVKESGSKAFDFATFYKAEKAFDSQRNLSLLLSDGLVGRNMEMAVGFMANHDTDDRENTAEDGFIEEKFKTMAYAYMLTHFKFSTLFYSDYEEKLDKAALNTLIKINKTIACGELNILFCNKQEYIAIREGRSAGADANPGLIVYFNISSGAKTHTVHTNWAEGTKLYDYSKNALPYLKENVSVGRNGFATITVAPNSYAVWSVKDLAE